MKNKTNKKRIRKIKKHKFSQRNKRSRRNKFSRRNKRQRGGKYNAEQIQQIIDTIKANDNLRDITDEEITQFINKINPNAAIFANVHHRHSRFPHLLIMIENIAADINMSAIENLQELGDELEEFIEAADNTDFESEDSDI